jgi:PAS domain S-box-containing protein
MKHFYPKFFHTVSEKSAGFLAIIIMIIIVGFDLLGWALDITVLKSVSPQWTSMRIITAICFLASASVLVSLRLGFTNRMRRAVSGALGAAVCSIGLLTAMSYRVELLTGHEWSLIHLPLLGAFLASPDRMSVITAIIFFNIGCVLILLGSGNRRAAGVGHIALLPAALMTYVVLTGYLLDVENFYHWLDPGVAFNTGIAFFALCIALFFARTDTWIMEVFIGDEAGGIMARRLMLPLIFVPLLIGWLRLNGERFGLFTSEVGVALVAVTYTLCFVGLVWLNARFANRIDRTRQRVANELRESEEKYRLIVESAAEGIWIVDRDYVTTFVNIILTDMLGYEKGEMIGMSPHNFMDEKFVPQAESNLEERKAGATQVSEFKMRRKDGSTIWVLSNASPILDKDGYYQGALSMITNITERKRAEEQINRQYALLDGINRIFEEALTCETEAGLGRICLIVAEELTQSTSGFIGQINNEGRLDDIAISDPGWEACRMANPTGHRMVPGGFLVHGIYGRVIHDGRGFFTNDPPSHPDTIGVPAGHPPLSSFLGAPLIQGGKTIGMVGLANRRGGYCHEDLKALESLGGAMVQALMNFNARRALRESEERFRLLFHQAAVGIKRLDPEGRFLEVNDKLCDILGYPRSELLRLSLKEVTHPEDLPVELEQVRRLLSREIASYSIEKRCVRKDGRIIWALVASSRPAGDDRTVDWWVSVVEDITRRKLAEDAVNQTAEDLARSNKDLEQFAYVASHDLQEPLRAVAGFMGILNKRYRAQLDVKAREYVDQSIEGAERMQTLINDLLVFSRVGTKGGTFASMSMQKAADTALANLKVAIEESSALITSDPLPVVIADAMQMTQLLQNLIGNAIKFRGKERPTLYIGATREPRQWVFSIRDNGIGIEPQYYDRIFMIFQRLHTRERYGGTGIGLALCKRIVERHNGAIWVESKYQEGSTFFFTIPDEGENE